MTFYADTDEDGYGDPSQSQLACEVPEGMVIMMQTVMISNHWLIQILQKLVIQLTTTVMVKQMKDKLTTYYADTDIDTFGDENMLLEACSAPDGYVENSDDCNDSNNLISPNASEICNDLDDDCNGFLMRAKIFLSSFIMQTQMKMVMEIQMSLPTFVLHPKAMLQTISTVMIMMMM